MIEKEQTQLGLEGKAVIYRDEKSKRINLLLDMGKYVITLDHEDVLKLSYLLEFWAPTH